MNAINSFNDLKALFESDNKPIIYGAGMVSRLLVLNLELWGYDDRVDFIAVKEVDDNATRVGDIPVVDIDSLSLYKNCRLLIATEHKLALSINTELNEKGYTDVYCLDEPVTELLKKDEWKAKKCLETKSIERLLRKITCIESKIEQQNEISEVNSRAFSRFKNCNTGKDIVIFASGPSAMNYKPIKNAVHVGVNRAWRREDISFDYYFIQDASGGKDNPMLPLLEENIVKCPLFVGTYFKRPSYYSSEYAMGYERDNNNVYRYYIDCVYDRRERGYQYYPNICHHPLLDYGSVVFPAIQFALFTNPRKLFLVGCDASLGPHFFDSSNELGEDDLIIPNCWKVGYTLMKAYSRLYYPDTEIVSVNPVNLKGLFKDMYT